MSPRGVYPKKITSPAERFWVKVDKTGDCWQWTGAIGPHGYGNFYAGANVWARAHRFSYQLCVGPIPEGLVLDHLCRNRSCVNPAHLEPVTQRTNTLRGDGPRVAAMKNLGQTRCKADHPLSGDNLYVQPKTGYRYCRTCQNRRNDDYRARRRAALV